MSKVLISIPSELAARMRVAFPVKNRSKIIVKLIQQEVLKREEELYKSALELTKCEELNEEMEEISDLYGMDGLDASDWPQPKTTEKKRSGK